LVESLQTIRIPFNILLISIVHNLNFQINQKQLIMFTSIEKNRKLEHSRLLKNITELHTLIYACRSSVLTSLKKENLVPDELSDLQEINWDLFVLEINSGSQRDQLKNRPHLDNAKLKVYVAQYEEYSAMYETIVQRINSGHNSLNGTNVDADYWFDWDYSESESREESFSPRK
ncbi:TPA: hypothetical protein ACPSJ9_003820, partial [Legionella anisa]